MNSDGTYEYYKEIRHPIGYGCVTPLLLQYSHALHWEKYASEPHISFNLLEGNEKVKPNDDTDEMMIGDA